MATTRRSGVDKRGSEDEGVIATASLELSVNNCYDVARPVYYNVTYTRGGWIWRTSHRYREWLALKDTLLAQFGARSLPDAKGFPKKEDAGAMVAKLLQSCQGCQEGGGPVGIAEERRQLLQAYFSEILMDHRDVWDNSEDVKRFFFPGPPTAYSGALAKRRSERLKEEKLKAKEAGSRRFAMTSTLKSTFGGIFESSSTPAAPPSTRSPKMTVEASSAEQGSSMKSSSLLSRMSAKMPSIQDFFFDGPAPQSTSRHGTDGGSRHRLVSKSTSMAPSESGATDPEGISEPGGSEHSSRE